MSVSVISVPVPVLIFFVALITSIIFRSYRRVSKIVWVSALALSGLTLLKPFESSYFSVNPFTRYLAVFCVVISFFIILYTDRDWNNLTLYGIIGFSSMAMALSTNFFVFYVLLEIVLVASTFTIYDFTLESVEAAEKYFVVNLFGSVAILMGIVLNFGYAGTVNPSSIVPLFVLILIAVGLLVKSAVFPFHVWVPDTYETAPLSTSAFLSGLLVNLGIFGFLKFLGFSAIKPLLGVLAILSMFYIALIALDEWDLRKLLAYSTVIHVGYIVLALGFAVDRFPVLLHVFNHGFAKALVFLAAGVFIGKTGESDLRKMKGVARNWIGFAFLAGLLSIAAIPPMNGFISELFIIGSILESGEVLPVIFLLSSYLIALVFYLRILYFLFLKGREPGLEIENVAWYKRISIWSLAFLVVLLGVFPDPLFWMAEAAMKCIPVF